MIMLILCCTHLEFEVTDLEFKVTDLELGVSSVYAPTQPSGTSLLTYRGTVTLAKNILRTLSEQLQTELFELQHHLPKSQSVFPDPSNSCLESNHSKI